MSVSLTWALHSNGIGPRDLEALTEIILELGHRVEHVRVVPFTHEAVDDLPTVEAYCLIYGSTALLNLARKTGWTPAGWDGPAFKLSASIDALGDAMLNHQALKVIWCNAGEIVRDQAWDKVFVRPDSETKEFAGTIYRMQELEALSKRYANADEMEQRSDPIMVGPLLPLGKEWRAFVVDGSVISVSRYAQDRLPNPQTGSPTEVVDFIQEVINVYQPAPCFVVDVAEDLSNTDPVLKVVEFNSINSSGFYACDKRAVIKALSDYVVGSL